MNIKDMLYIMVEKNASDLHLIAGIPPSIRIDGELSYLHSTHLTGKDLNSFFNELVEDPAKKNVFFEDRELDFAYELKGEARFRVNVYFQKSIIAFAIRLIPVNIPKLEDLNLPNVLKDLTRKPNGLILVTGPTGSGKSTSLAAMIDMINEEQSLHVVTVEDPIEYVYKPKKCIISQREVGEDTLSFSNALKRVLRQDPDVILIGEMRDLETMQAAITAAETGHLVFSTLHTTSASQTIDRIIDVFPPYQQPQIRSQLSITLQAVITQKLLKRIDIKGRIPTTEVLIITPAVRNMIREGKTYQVYSSIELGKEHGMHTMEQNLNYLLSKRMIKWEDAYAVASMADYIKHQGVGNNK
jgi:twitching motility protein PilT